MFWKVVLGGAGAFTIPVILKTQAQEALALESLTFISSANVTIAVALDSVKTLEALFPAENFMERGWEFPILGGVPFTFPIGKRVLGTIQCYGSVATTVYAYLKGDLVPLTESEQAKVIMAQLSELLTLFHRPGLLEWKE